MSKRILNQSSKSTSSKKMRRKRDISPVRPYSEFPATTSTFSGLGNIVRILSLITILGFSTILYSNNTYASSISISLTGNVNLNILKDNTNPTFGKSTTQTATVTSDHFTGYTLTIAGSNDTGRLVGSNDSTKYLSSITTPLTEAQFNTDAHNDQWGFLPSSLYNASTSTTITNTDYQPSPIHTTPTTMDVTNSPTDNDGNNYTLALASRISPNMSLDSYGQTFVLAATGNGYDYHIGYTDSLSTIPADQYATGSASNTVQLSSATPVKSGYIFNGWCSQATVNTEFSATCPSGATVYQPGATVTLDGASANNMELYAIWEPVTFSKAFELAGVTANMQNMTTSICNAIAIGQEGTLTDTRGGGKNYTVGKLKDGRCWMLDNLALGSNSQIALKTTDTNIATDWNLPASVTNLASYTDARINTAYNNIIPTDPMSTEGGWKVGTYYNYCAASAGTYCYAENAAPSDRHDNMYDICPKGWRMPSGGLGGEYQDIYAVYENSYTDLRIGMHLPNSGYYYPDQIGVLGIGGRWWANAFYDIKRMYGLRVQEGEVVSDMTLFRDRGISMRCIAK